MRLLAVWSPVLVGACGSARALPDDRSAQLAAVGGPVSESSTTFD